MASKKLIKIFEEVRTGKKGISSTQKKRAELDAAEFWKKCKEFSKKMSDKEIEEEARHLSEIILGNKTLLLGEITRKIDELKLANTQLEKGEKKKVISSPETIMVSFFKKKIKAYFKQRKELEQTKLGDKNLIALETLEKIIKKPEVDDNYNYKDILSMINLRFKRKLEADDNAIIDIITRVWLLASKDNTIEVNSNHFVKILYRNNSLFKPESLKKSEFNNTVYIEDHTPLTRLIRQFDEGNKTFNIAKFWKWILTNAKLTPKEKMLIEILFKEAEFIGSYKAYEAKCLEIFNNYGYSENYFRTLLWRIRDEMKRNSGKDALDLLQFVPAEYAKFERILFSLDLDSALPLFNKQLSDFDELFRDEYFKALFKPLQTAAPVKTKLKAVQVLNLNNEELVFTAMMQEISGLLTDTKNSKKMLLITKMRDIFNNIANKYNDGEAPYVGVIKNRMPLLFARLMEELMVKRKIDIEIFSGVRMQVDGLFI